MSGPPEPVAELSAFEANLKGVRVRFYRHEDRYQHAVDAIVRGRIAPLLESVEGDASYDWPPSPPFRDLQCRSDTGNTIFLTGAAGKSHWSASIRVTSEVPACSDGDNVTSIELPNYTDLLFEVACRFRLPPHWIGSSYRVLGDCAGSLAAFSFAGVKNGPVVAIHGKPSECRIAESRGTDGSRLLTVQPPAECPVKLPATVRWTYRIFLATI